jgi:hypothetical protein
LILIDTPLVTLTLVPALNVLVSEEVVASVAMFV